MLHDSGQAYDSGKIWEAKRLATTVYTLLHDGKRRTCSVLTQLGRRRAIQYFSTSRGLEAYPRVALCQIKMSQDKKEYVPHCHLNMDFPWFSWKSFDDWWEEKVFETTDGRILTRKNVVFSIRDTDGGSHFDSEWGDEAYQILATVNDSQVTCANKPIPFAHLATMRQIAWELERSLQFFFGVLHKL